MRAVKNPNNPSSHMPAPKPRIWISVCLLILFSILPNSLAKILDNGVDPANLGKGDWIYFLDAAVKKLGGNVETVTNVPSLMKFYKSQGIDFLCVKAGTGPEEFPSEKEPQFTKELVDEAHAAGIKIFGYTRS